MSFVNLPTAIASTTSVPIFSDNADLKLFPRSYSLLFSCSNDSTEIDRGGFFQDGITELPVRSFSQAPSDFGCGIAGCSCRGSRFYSDFHTAKMRRTSNTNYKIEYVFTIPLCSKHFKKLNEQNLFYNTIKCLLMIGAVVLASLLFINFIAGIYAGISDHSSTIATVWRDESITGIGADVLIFSFLGLAICGLISWANELEFKTRLKLEPEWQFSYYDIRGGKMMPVSRFPLC